MNNSFRIKKDNSFKTALILFLVSASLLSTLIFFIYSNHKNAEVLKNLISIELAKKDQVGLLKETIENNLNKTKIISSQFIQKDNAIPFLEEIESLGALSGTSVEIIGVDQNICDKDCDYPDTLEVKLLAKGNWGQVSNFLSLLETMSKKIIINSSDMSLRTSESEEYWQLDMVMRGFLK